MTHPALLDLVHNASLLLAIALVYEVVADRTTPARHLQRQAFFGLVVGAIGIAVMLTPWQYVPGIVFDTRSVLLAVTGRFFGPVPTVIAVAMTAAFRLYQGGDAALTGVLVIVASAGIGMAWRQLRRKRTRDVSFGEIFLLGIVVHVTMLALMFTLPWDTALRVVSAIALPVLVIYPLATALLGAMIAKRRRGNWLVTQLRESEERLRLALAAANQGLWDLDVASGAVDTNRSYATMLGYDPATFHLTLTTWSELLHPDDRERVMATFRDYVEGNRPDYWVEFRMRAASGDWHWILSCGSIVAHDPQGKPSRMIGTHTDITALRAAEAETRRLLAESDQSRLALQRVVEDLRATEEKLTASEAFYRGLFENMHEGFAYCRMIFAEGRPVDFVYLRVNPSFERMRGIGQAQSRRASEVLPGFPDANPELLETYAQVTATGEPQDLETYIERLDRWYLVSVFSPHAGHFVSAWIDITDRKRAEIENRKRLDELTRWYKVTLGRESRVSELKAEVNELRRRLGEPPGYAHAAGDRPAQEG